MPHPDQKPASSLPARRALLSLVAPAEPTNADLLRAIAALADKVDRLEAVITPRRSQLALGPDDIARTMAMLRSARHVQAKKETPP